MSEYFTPKTADAIYDKAAVHIAYIHFFEEMDMLGEFDDKVIELRNCPNDDILRMWFNRISLKDEEDFLASPKTSPIRAKIIIGIAAHHALLEKHVGFQRDSKWWLAQKYLDYVPVLDSEPPCVGEAIH